MDTFRVLTGRAAPLARPNVDTDAIIPSREMKTVSKAGLGVGLFANWRYSDVDGRIEAPQFVLNQPRYRGAKILIGGENFGCGSSREHAVWALADYGVRCVVAPSFGTIFQANCVRNGLLPAVVSAADAAALTLDLETAADPILLVDLEARTIRATEGQTFPFSIHAADRDMLMSGLDPIGLTLLDRDVVTAFEHDHRAARPWLFNSPIRF